MNGIKKTGRLAACGVATIAAFALLAGSAQASSQAASCSSLGLLSPILGNPTCTTAPVFADRASDVGHTFVYAAQSRASSVLLPAGVRIDLFINGLFFGQIAKCDTIAATCVASFGNSGPVIPLGWRDIRIRCTWTSKLAIIATTDCKQSLVTTPPTVPTT